MGRDLLHHFTHEGLASGKTLAQLADEELKALVPQGACQFLFGFAQRWRDNQVVAQEQAKALQDDLLVAVDDGHLPPQ